MAIHLLDRAVGKAQFRVGKKIPKLVLPDFDKFITAEAPAITLQLAPALEDLVALTTGLPAELPAQMEAMLSAQAAGAFPGAVAVGVAVGAKPDYALFLKPLAELTDAEKKRFPDELGKLLKRRQNFGIYLGPAGRSGLAGRQKGTAQIGDDCGDTLTDQSGAPFTIRVDLAALSAAANGRIAEEAPRYGLDGGECGCGPVAVESLTIRERDAGKLETVVTGQVDLLLGALHAGFALTVSETLAVTGDGTLAAPKAEAAVKVLQIVGANLPAKLKKVLERDVVQALLAMLFPLATLLKLALRAVASGLATKRINDGEDVRGPVHDALESALGPQLVRGTDQRLFFEITSASTPEGAVKVKGVVRVTERLQAVRIGLLAAGRRVEGDVFDVRVRAIPTDLAAPVTYTWTCQGVTQTAGAEATVRVDLAAGPEFAVEVSAEDAEGFTAPAAKTRFRRVGPAIGGRVTFAGVPV